MHPQTVRARILRRSMNRTEWKVWGRLSGRKMAGFKFRRQHPLGPYVVDFYCPAARLVVEIDGPGHANGEMQDLRRTAWLYEHGYHLIRFWVAHVDEDLGSVCETILRELDDLASPSHGEGALARRASPGGWGPIEVLQESLIGSTFSWPP